MIFWHNLFRYPRFFVSSMIGLMLIVINPLLNIIKKNFKTEKFLLWLGICSIIVLILVYLIVGKMISSD